MTLTNQRIVIIGGSAMCTAAVPPSAPEALRMLQALLAALAGEDAAGLPAEVLAERLRVLEQADAMGAAARGRLWRRSRLRTGTSRTGSAPSGPGWSTPPG